MAQRSNFTIALMDRTTGRALSNTGGKFIVCTAGTGGKATLLDSTGAALTNPVTASGGVLTFAIAGAPIAQSVDIFGIAGDGSAVIITAAKPGDPTEFWVETSRRNQTAIFPFLGSDYTAAAENTLGVLFPVGAIILPAIATKTLVAQSGKTFDFGMLSSDSGGDADGLLVGASLAATGTIIGKISSTRTLGALVIETATGAAAVVSVPYVTLAALTPSITPSSGTTTGACLIQVPYLKPAS